MNPEQRNALLELSAAANELVRSDEWSQEIDERGVWGFVEESEKELAEDDVARIARLQQAVNVCRQLFQL